MKIQAENITKYSEVEIQTDLAVMDRQNLAICY